MVPMMIERDKNFSQPERGGRRVWDHGAEGQEAADHCGRVFYPSQQNDYGIAYQRYRD